MRRIKIAWTRLINAGADGLRLYEHRQGICRGVNILSAAIAALNLTVGPAFGLATHKFPVLMGSIAEALIVSGNIALNYHRKYLAASISLFILLNLATLYFGSILGPSVGAQIMIILLVVLALFLFETKLQRAVAISCSILSIALMELNFKFRVIPSVEAARNVTDYMRWAADITVGSLVILLFHLYDRNNTRLLVKLKDFSRQTDLNLQHEKVINEQKSRFIRNAYHEVRSQFRFVSMIVRMLHEANKRNNLTPEMLDTSLKDLSSGDQLLEMTLINILEYSKFDAGVTDRAHLEYLNLRIVVGDLVNLFKYLARSKGLTIDLEFGDDIEFYLTDRAKLTGILTNLIHNSYKFSHSGSTIRVVFSKWKDHLRITVADQGRGIPKEQLPHIFNPWFSDRSITNGEGVGLGLGIVQQLVQQLDGEIKVHTKKDLGTTFTVFLPHKDSYNPERHIVKEQILRF